MPLALDGERFSTRAFMSPGYAGLDPWNNLPTACAVGYRYVAGYAGCKMSKLQASAKRTLGAGAARAAESSLGHPKRRQAAALQMAYHLSMRLSAGLLWIAVALCVATADAGRLPFRLYRTAQGLPRNSATCLVAGQNGVMWFCTTEGLARFDGHEFRVFGPKQGLPSSIVYGLFPSRTGGYWLITDKGLCR